MDFKLFLLDENFQAIMVLPSFSSFIWTECYSEPGSFEVMLPYTLEVFKSLQSEARYLYRDDLKKIGYIREFVKSTNSSQGAALLFSGPLLEGFMQKKVYFATAQFQGYLPLTRALQGSLIPCFSPHAELDDSFGSDYMWGVDACPAYFEMNMQTFFYTAFKNFGISLTHTKIGDKVVFKLWKGEDRTAESESSNALILSEQFKNIHNIKYNKSEAACYNYIIGNGYCQELSQYRNTPISYVYNPEELNQYSIDANQTIFSFDLITETVETELGPMVVVDENASRKLFLQKAAKYTVPIAESFSAELIEPKKVSLGDVVTIKDIDTGIVYHKRVEKVVHSYNPSQSKSVVTFGDSVQTLKSVLNKSIGMG